MPRILFCIVALLLPLAAQQLRPSQPRLLHKVLAQYSAQARENKIEGTVTLNIVVPPDGHPTQIEVKKSLDPELDQNAIAAVKQWVFQPGIDKNGEPISVFATIQVPFSLK